MLEESLDHLSLRYRFQFILIARAISFRAQIAYKTARKLTPQRDGGRRKHLLVVRSFINELIANAWN